MSDTDLSKFDHVDLLYPSKYVKAADLRKRDVVVVIESIEPRHELVSQGNKRERKPVFNLKDKDKQFVCNKTNAKTIAKIYGPNPRDWIGKAITLYPTTVQAGGEEHECIRIRQQAPSGNGHHLDGQDPIDDGYEYEPGRDG